MIQSFSDRTTEVFFVTGRIGKDAGWKPVAAVARRKLDMVHYAARLEDLRSPPGNCLEPLKGSLDGYHSVRINERWRVVFRWTTAGPSEVMICDYHR